MLRSASVSALGEQLEPLAWAGVHRVDQVFVAGDDSRRQRVQPRVAQRAEQQAKHRGGGGRLGRLRQIWWTAASTEVVVFACTRTWEVRVKIQRSEGSRCGRFDRFCVGFLRPCRRKSVPRESLKDAGNICWTGKPHSLRRILAELGAHRVGAPLLGPSPRIHAKRTPGHLEPRNV